MELENPERFASSDFVTRRLRQRLDQLFIESGRPQAGPNELFQRLRLEPAGDSDVRSGRLTRMHPSRTIELAGSADYMGMIELDINGRQFIYSMFTGAEGDPVNDEGYPEVRLIRMTPMTADLRERPRPAPSYEVRLILGYLGELKPADDFEADGLE